MAVQTAIEQPVVVPRDQQDLLASPIKTRDVTQPWQGKQLSERPPAGPEAPETKPAPRGTQQRSVSTAAVVGALVLVPAAFFVAGFLWERLRPAMRRLKWRAEEIRIPLALPVTIVEVARELYADRDSQPQAARHEPRR